MSYNSTGLYGQIMVATTVSYHGTGLYGQIMHPPPPLRPELCHTHSTLQYWVWDSLGQTKLFMVHTLSNTRSVAGTVAGGCYSQHWVGDGNHRAMGPGWEFQGVHPTPPTHPPPRWESQGWLVVVCHLLSTHNQPSSLSMDPSHNHHRTRPSKSSIGCWPPPPPPPPPPSAPAPPPPPAP